MRKGMLYRTFDHLDLIMKLYMYSNVDKRAVYIDI